MCAKTKEGCLIKISTLTDQNLRDANQDSALIVPKIINGKRAVLCMVADGMGGTDEGGIASAIVKERVEQWIEKNPFALFDGSEITEDYEKTLTDLVTRINREIFDYGAEYMCSLGSTIALIYIAEISHKSTYEYIALNIGDSRIYKFTDKRKGMQITKDQTAAQMEIDRGNMTKEEAGKSPLQHKLTQCLGMETDPVPDFFRGKTKKGDYIMICSDGIYNRTEIDEIGEIIRAKKKTTKQKLMLLIDKAKESGEKDNATGIMIEV